MNVNTSQWRVARSRHKSNGVPGSPSTCLVVARSQTHICVYIEGYHSFNFKVWTRAGFNKHWEIDRTVVLDPRDDEDVLDNMDEDIYGITEEQYRERYSG